MCSDEAILQVKGLSFSYAEKEVIRDISFHVRRGELCGLFGPNGCGKTTIFRCCLNFLKAQSGLICINGVTIDRLSVPEMAHRVAYVPQDHKPLFPYLVKEVVLMGRTPHMGGIFGINPFHRRKVDSVLNMLGIEPLANQKYSELSSGQRQLVLIARAIAQETGLILLDEPTSSLDFYNQLRIWQLLRDSARRGVAIAACSHDPNHVALYCDRAVMMNSKGCILASGPPREVMNDALLDCIYRDTCRVRDIERTPVVLPREVIERNRSPH